MKKPKMIIFDYGQTLINELYFNPLEGTKEILSKYSTNPNGVKAEQINELAYDLIKNIRNFQNQDNEYLEIHNHQIQNYIYEYFDVTVNLTMEESEKIFWDAAAPCKLTNNILELLNYLNKQNIKIRIISNIAFSGNTLKRRLKDFLPEIEFDFIISSADYIFRKPNQKIFEFSFKKVQKTIPNISKEEVWYCGDDYLCDMVGSTNIGYKGIWYKVLSNDKRNIKNKEIIEIYDWLELIEILKTCEK